MPERCRAARIVRFSEDLRERHAAGLHAFVEHPFFRAAERGALSPEARDAYFVNERYFVGAAQVIFAHLLTQAPSRPAARHIVSILDALVNEQEALFDRIYATLGLSDPPCPSSATRALADGMIDIARAGPYAAGIAAMSAAEWSYAQVARHGCWAAAPDPTLRDWFALHGEPRFLAGVDWLCAELDAVQTDSDGAAIDAAFARAIDLEIEFHAEPMRA